MLLGTFLLEHLAEASESGTGSLSNDDFGILKTSLNEGPEGFEVRLNEEGATFDDDTESSDSRFAETGIGRRGESADLFEERREDLSGRKGSGENVDNSESGTGGNIIVNVDRFRLGTDGEKGGNDGTGEVKLLNL